MRLSADKTSVNVWSPSNTSDLSILEAQLKRLDNICAANSGLENYQQYSNRRKEVLAQIEQQRPLSRWEYINGHGYGAWREYTDKHGLPENHPFADADSSVEGEPTASRQANPELDFGDEPEMDEATKESIRQRKEKAELAYQAQKAEEDRLFGNAQVIPSDKVQRTPSYQPDYTIEQAIAILHGQGFKCNPEEGTDRSGSRLYIFRNELTGQKANLSHYYKDKKGRPINEAKIAYHQVKGERTKRRTTEEKDRANFVLYD